MVGKVPGDRSHIQHNHQITSSRQPAASGKVNSLAHVIKQQAPSSSAKGVSLMNRVDVRPNSFKASLGSEQPFDMAVSITTALRSGRRLSERKVEEKKGAKFDISIPINVGKLEPRISDLAKEILP